MTSDLVKVSRFLSLVLRHKPEEIGLTLDANGWADVEQLIALVNQSGRPLSRALLEQVVAGNDKQRFAFNADHTRIRASQGHSVAVDLDLPAREPPEILFHGTAVGGLESIRVQGLLRGKRQHVHLSRDAATAIKVGQRHGKPVVLQVRAGEMYRSGYRFFCSANSVWLTEQVPPRFLQFPTS